MSDSLEQVVSVEKEVPIQELLLEAVKSWPGEWTPQEHAKDLGLSVKDVRKAVYNLSRSGKLASRAYRLHEHTVARIDSGRSTDSLCSESYWRADGFASAVRIVELLRERGPLTGKELAQIGGYDALPGNWKRALRGLTELGLVSFPTCLWATCGEEE